MFPLKPFNFAYHICMNWLKWETLYNGPNINKGIYSKKIDPTLHVFNSTIYRSFPNRQQRKKYCEWIYLNSISSMPYDQTMCLPHNRDKTVRFAKEIILERISIGVTCDLRLHATFTPRYSRLLSLGPFLSALPTTPRQDK